MNETRIAELRRAKGWTQERLAEASGIAVRTIQRVESGQDASLSTLSAIADALETPVRDLFATVEKESFEAAVDALDDRREAAQARLAAEEAERARQQEQRDSVTRGADMVFHGLGVVVVFLSLFLSMTTRLGWFVWLLVPIYWGAGRYLFRALMHAVLRPRLDRKYPLSRATSARERADRDDDRRDRY